MKLHFTVCLCTLMTLLAVQRSQPAMADDALTEEQLEFFEKQVRPVLVNRCYDCHGDQADEPDGGLRLDSRQGLLNGGESGAAVVPGEPDRSLLIRAVRYADPLLQMPPDGKLPDREIAALAKWVQWGLPDPRGDSSMPAPEVRRAAFSDELKNWWAFQPVQDTEPPEVSDTQWPLDTIDRFVLAGLEAAGMSPAAQADRLTLIRRVTFDLTGLPPSPEEIESFLADDSPDAFAVVVERLLQSPQYGARWGRHWLDLVRYADTSGCNGDFPIQEAYRYRDYVIESFNRDKAYDQFVREQIAGDLLPAESDEQRFEQITATGYLAISRRFSSVAEEFHLTLDDTLDNLGKTFLGLSVSCARCHEHKFDPIPQEDYYALYGILESTRYAFPGTEIYRHTQHLVPLVSSEQLRELQPWLDRMEELDTAMYDTYTRMAMLDTGDERNDLRNQWQAMQKERDDLLRQLPEFPKAYAASEGKPVNSRLHLKGNHESLGAEVPRGFLQILGGHRVPAESEGSGRWELAQWLTDPDNPLTARVLVNRVWLHHFGHGLVRTPDDFGTRGSLPTHPELLDYLAREFIRGGWSIKELHRRILLSRTWQMACVEHPEYARQDPENRLLWTFNRRRMSAEELRDSLLAVSGELSLSPGGQHPFPPEVEWRFSQHRPFVEDYPTRHRAVYLMQQRIRQQPYLGIFDGADTNAVTGQRQTSTTPQQALFHMNSELVHSEASNLARRLNGEAETTEQRVQRAFQLALGRPAEPMEVDEAISYLTEAARRLPDGEDREARSEQAWESWLRVLLGSNEFLFIE